MTTQPPPATTEPGDDAASVTAIMEPTNTAQQEVDRLSAELAANHATMVRNTKRWPAETASTAEAEPRMVDTLATELAALRARLETAETALRRIAYETSNVPSETVGNTIFNIAATALRAEGGEEGGDAAVKMSQALKKQVFISTTRDGQSYIYQCPVCHRRFESANKRIVYCGLTCSRRAFRKAKAERLARQSVIVSA